MRDTAAFPHLVWFLEQPREGPWCGCCYSPLVGEQTAVSVRCRSLGVPPRASARPPARVVPGTHPPGARSVAVARGSRDFGAV